MPAKVSTKISPDFVRRLKDHVKRTKVVPCLNRVAANWNRDPSIRRRIVNTIKETKTWQALLGHLQGNNLTDLQAVLGIEDPAADLNAMENFLYEAVEVRKTAGFPSRGVEVGFMSQAKLNQLLSADFGAYVSEPSGEPIAWLKWILTRVSDPVVGYTIGFANDIGELDFSDSLVAKKNYIRAFDFKSRTGRALMFKNEDGSGSWDIGPHLDALGTQTNFLVDAFERDATLQDFFLRKFQRDIRTCLSKSGLTRIGPAAEVGFT